MKRQILFIVLAIVGLAMNLMGRDRQKQVEGNGNLITHEIEINDYNTLTITGGTLEINYERNDKSPYLKITIDENLYPLLKIESQDKTLLIGYKRYYNLRPTKFKIITNSTELITANLAGEGQLYITNIPTEGELKLNLAGGINAFLKDKFKGKKLNGNLAGGSTIQATVDCPEVSASVAGGGDIILKGKVMNGSLNVAGGGIIRAFDCLFSDVAANVAGGGKIEVYASKKLSASVIGGGKVTYRGNPQLSKTTINGGNVRKL